MIEAVNGELHRRNFLLHLRLAHERDKVNERYLLPLYIIPEPGMSDQNGSLILLLLQLVSRGKIAPVPLKENEV